jgi:hypothetical protein
MIDIKNLTQDDIGRWVTYRSSGGDKVERGKLKSWNSTNIFVVYNANDNWDSDHWKDYTGASTRPEDLEFES